MTRDWTRDAVTPDEAVAAIGSGVSVFVHGAAATPTPLLEALARRSELSDVTLYHMHTQGPAPFAAPEQRGRFFSVSLFVGPALREPVREGRADFIPIFLSDIPILFLSRQLPLDVALLQLSPPDRHGYCTLGTSVDTALAASHAARILIGEINEQMPRTLGNTLVPITKLHAWVHTNRPLQAHAPTEPNEVEDAIGEQVAALVPDGATLQMGIGAIPWVVTEYGAVDLFGKPLRARTEALISIAHPDFRAELRHAFAETRHYVLAG